MNLYSPINPVFYKNVSDDLKRVVLFDPTEIYQRIEINPFKRWQPVSIDAFPVIPEYCSCGCGTKLSGRKTRWASPDHAIFALTVIRIIQGVSDVIRNVMHGYINEKCAMCGKGPYILEKQLKNGIHVDHIIPVNKGGGG